MSTVSCDRCLKSALLILVLLAASSLVRANPVACVDPFSDPDGDRWGWENGQSCLVVSRPPVVICSSADSDPDGDGWGWENNSSCQIAGEGTSTIVTDPEPGHSIPDLVGTIVLPFLKYPDSLSIGTDGSIYYFQPPTNVLAAMDSSGNILWERRLDSSLFVSDINLDPAESQLIISFLGGGLGSFGLNGNPQWMLEYPGNLAPEVQIGESAIIAKYTSDRVGNVARDHFVASVGYEGELRWKFETEHSLGTVTLGNDEYVYIRVSNGDIAASEEILIFRQ